MTVIRSVGVLGCGLMGSGIAQAAAMAGYQVRVRDTQSLALEKGHRSIDESLAKMVAKGKLQPAEREAALSRISLVLELEALSDVDLVIEAVTEDLELKNRLWTALDLIAQPRAIFASNTSSLSIVSMAAVTGRPDRFLGLHFFSPVPLMPLVEVVRSITTSESTFETGMDFARSLGKEAIAARDTPGFVVNLLLVPYLLDAVRAAERGVASVADIDTGMKLGCGYPMGPLQLIDLVGVDVICSVGEILYREFRETRYAPPPLLMRMNRAGWLGRKAGRGFYDYTSDPAVPVVMGLR